MWLPVEVTHVDAGITTMAVGDRFAIALSVDDAVLDQNGSIGGGQFPNLLSNFTVTPFPTNIGTWTPPTFDLPASNFVTNAFGNGFTFQVHAQPSFSPSSRALAFWDVDLNFAWLGDITDSGSGNSLAQRLGATFDPSRAVLGSSAIRFSPPNFPQATLAVASDYYLWINPGTGNWTTATNWRPHGLPNYTTDVNISNGGTAQITAAGAQARRITLGQHMFGGSGHLELTGSPASLTAERILVGDDGVGSLLIAAGADLSTTHAGAGGYEGSSGTITVTGAGSTWTNTDGLELGESGDLSMTISNGGVVTSGGGSLADDDPSIVFVSVTGAGSRWNMNDELIVADDGMATLNILNGGAVTNTNATIGADTIAVGTVTVSGSGSTWTNNGSLTVGVEAQGTLNIADGGSVSNHDGHIGLMAGSTGMVTVTGAGSTWNSSTTLTVGDSGTGTLIIEDGGVVSSLHGGLLGANSASNGTATVRGAGSSWTNGTNLRVGHNGTGTLRIEDGGHVSNLYGVVGDFAGSSGTALVSGAGSTWTNSANLIVAHSSTGALTIEDGGKVSNVDGYIGHDSGSLGTVIVNGAGSTWTNTGTLAIGNEGTGAGTLRIEAGGNVSNTMGIMGYEAGTSAAVSVTGAGSTWTNGNFLVIGVEGKADLTIASGGRVSDTVGDIGRFAGSNGTALVTGAGSMWFNSSRLAVGDEGTGMLTIQNGGEVSSTDASIGFAAGSNGTVAVTGASSKWTVNGQLSVGGDALFGGGSGGTGRLDILLGGSVNVAQETVLFPNGLVRLDGGTFDAAEVGFQGGGFFQFVSGTLHVGVFNGNLKNLAGTLAPGHAPSAGSAGSTTIIGNYTQKAGAELEIEIGGTSAGGTYDLVGITGNATLAGQLQLAMLGAFVPSPSDTFTVLNAAGGIFGVFSNVTTGQRLSTSDGNGSFLVHYGPGSAFNPNQIILSDFQAMLLAGDYNADGIVDGGDYTVWRKTLGQVGFALAADGNRNLEVDAGDFNIWRANFGRASSAGSSVGSGTGLASASLRAVTVPEPASVLLMLVVGAVGGIARRRRTVWQFQLSR
jgi:T5SS/PEP-CTERM-associated repeat protein